MGLGLLLLGACEGFQIGDDALIQHLPPGQDRVCRAAVREALAEKNVSEDWVRRIFYRAVREGNRITGFEAWVYPEDGLGTGPAVNRCRRDGDLGGQRRRRKGPVARGRDFQRRTTSKPALSRWHAAAADSLASLSPASRRVSVD
jgi:hypothetical protein